jgi:hypothetical protein
MHEYEISGGLDVKQNTQVCALIYLLRFSTLLNLVFAILPPVRAAAFLML